MAGFAVGAGASQVLRSAGFTGFWPYLGIFGGSILTLIACALVVRFRVKESRFSRGDC